MNGLVEFKDVTKRFGSEVALEHFVLTIAPSQTTVLIGPSGCGKSTALRLIAGLEHADEGEVLFDNEPIAPPTLTNFRRRLGYVIQEGGLFPHLTARANLALQPHFFGKENAQIEERIGELCTLTRFPKTALNRYPLELSGGQRQRVTLMRALMLSPELLLLDEPFAALDPLVRANLQRDLKDICQQLNQTVLIVTHDLAEAAHLGDRIVLMSHGRIVQQGNLDQLRENPANHFVTEFINAQSTAALRK